MFVSPVRLGPGIMKVGPAVVALFVCAGQAVQRRLPHRRLHRPLKRIDRTHHQHRSLSIPTHIAQRFLPIFRAQRLKRPRRVRAQLRRHAQFAQNLPRFLIARDHQRIPAIAPAHLRDQRIHVSGLGAVADRQLVLRRRYSQRPDHHRRQRICELRLKHRTFTRHHTVMLGHFIRQEGRENIRQPHLRRAFEISTRTVEIKRHHAEVDVLRPQNPADLPQHLLHSHIRSRVARPVVTRKQQLQFLARLPRLALAHHPLNFLALDNARYPRFQNEVHHAAEPPAFVLSGQA